MGSPTHATQPALRQRRGMTTTTHISPAPALRAAGFVGRLVETGDHGYDSARAVFNGAES